jgi:biotin carboxyl carrier protein
VPGTIVAVHVSPGDQVSTGDALVVLEAMKMEHRITADTDASVVEVVVAVGDAVDAHEVLVVLEPLASATDPTDTEES